MAKSFPEVRALTSKGKELPWLSLCSSELLHCCSVLLKLTMSVLEHRITVRLNKH